MKAINFLSGSIYVGRVPGKGRGVFALTAIEKDTIIEIAPVVVMSGEDRRHIDQTLLHDYIFEWGEKGIQCCMAMGYVPLYNHSYESNCEYEMNFRKELITVRTVRRIKKGEELFINYNGDWDNGKKVWFEVK